MWANQKGNDSVSVFRIAPPSSPVAPRLRARSATLELGDARGGMVLQARKAGLYVIRQIAASGRVLSEEKLNLAAGRHPLAALLPGATLVEAETGSEKVTLAR